MAMRFGAVRSVARGAVRANRQKVLTGKRRLYSTNSGPNNSQTPKTGISTAVAGATLAVASGLSFYVGKLLNDGPECEKGSKPSVNRNLEAAKYATREEFSRHVLPKLEKILSEDQLSTDEEVRHLHGSSEYASEGYKGLPYAVVFPNTTEEVSEIAKICHAHRVPMIPYSGGTSLEGHFSAPHGGVCISFTNMDKVLAVRPDDLDCTVQPGVGWMDLNKHLEEGDSGLFFAVDPGPTAKIGGMIATSCSGTNCVRYGPMRNHIINLTVVLADGTIIKTRQRPRKTSAGYNLNHLFCGSEGTLGFITEATVKLEPVPQETSVAVCSFPTVHEATSAATDIIRSGIPVHAVELMDEVQMFAINKAGYTERKWDENPTLFFKFSGHHKSVAEQIEVAKAIAQKHDSIAFDFAKSEAEKHQLWSARKEVLWSMMALAPKDGRVYSTDVAVPMSRLADLVLETQKEIRKAGLFGSTLGHIGDGNYHSSIAYSPDQYDAVKKLVKKTVEIGLKMEGTCTGEHGVGAGKLDMLVDEVGSDTVSVMRTIRLALDPHELMNPGKVFSTDSIRNGIQRGR
ncbi:D-lactate dehydrogenase [cytochrome] 1, mitochondrial [Trichomonascus vanleenenianus]|uniref:D-lactate dehydrogenase [cytochrome] 1, mitochondrial n=1 Tax=Trichomonascus vanleenenianus TaxID=2268995 RepID=UPI003ECAF889